MTKDNSKIEVKLFFDGTQSITEAFAVLVAQRTLLKNNIADDIALKKNMWYNTDNKGINCLPSGHVGD